MTTLKICYAASSGGHFEQLMMLYPLMRKNEGFIITEKTNYKVNSKDIRTYEVAQINRREKFFIINFIKLFIHSFFIYFKEKPDIVLSTGALSTIPILLIAKLFRKKIIFIESFSKINTPTVTGKLMYKIADLFIVQWEEMKEHYPNAMYGGGIY